MTAVHPAWQESITKNGTSALVRVRTSSGNRIGYRMPRTSLVDRAAREKSETRSKKK